MDALQLEPALDALTGLDWVGRLEEVDAASPARRCRYVLLVDPQTTLLAPLLVRLLVERSPSLQALWAQARLEELMLADALLP